MKTEHIDVICEILVQLKLGKGNEILSVLSISDEYLDELTQAIDKEFINIPELIRCLEIRKRQLTGELDLGYKLHSGHHLRDVMTTLAVLQDKPEAEGLLKNMPKLKP